MTRTINIVRIVLRPGRQFSSAFMVIIVSLPVYFINTGNFYNIRYSTENTVPDVSNFGILLLSIFTNYIQKFNLSKLITLTVFFIQFMCTLFIPIPDPEQYQ